MNNICTNSTDPNSVNSGGESRFTQEQQSRTFGLACSKHEELNGLSESQSGKCIGRAEERRDYYRQHQAELRELGSAPVGFLYSLELKPIDGGSSVWKLGHTCRPLHRTKQILGELRDFYTTDVKPSYSFARPYPLHRVLNISTPMRLIEFSTAQEAAEVESKLQVLLSEFNTPSLCKFSGETELFKVDPLDCLGEVSR